MLRNWTIKIEKEMSTVNSVRIMSESASESGSDGVETYVDPVRDQEKDNEEEGQAKDVLMNNGGDDDLKRNNMTFGGDAGEPSLLQAGTTIVSINPVRGVQRACVSGSRQLGIISDT